MPETSFSNLVVIGSSAGGIEALRELVSTLPEDFPVPVVVAQHLDPQRESHLKEILSRRSPLPVRTVTDHAALEAGVIFVVPSNRHVDITDSEIGLHEDSAGRPMPSVDRLLSSAAGVYGERLIAVILTGTGSDGTGGARVVKRAGGTVLIQDPETAEYGGMPGSLAPNTVDIVAGLDRIGPILMDLISDIDIPEERPRDKEEPSLKQFLEELRERYGVDFRNYKTPTITRRLKRRLVATGSETIEDYSRYLEDHPEEYQQLINTFLIKVTEFFRDPELFEHLKEEVLPELIEAARREENQLRIWSAGCATGEEAYTLAILISEVLGDEAGLFNVRIFATDVDEEAVEYARRGIYPAPALSGLSEEQIGRYFIEENGQYQVKKQVRSMIVFGQHDLARRSPFPRIDLVVSRNVLIYFTAELQRRALRLFAYSLRDGGYLVLGRAETTSQLGEFFTQPDRRLKVYRRRGERFLMPTNPVASPASAPRQRPEHGEAHARALSAPGRDPKRARATEEVALNQLPAGVVIVDRRYDIQVINAAARHLLSIHGVAVGDDLLHLLQNVPYAEVRRAIDAAFRNGESAYTGEFAVENVATGELRYLQLVCSPQRAGDGSGKAEAVTVMVNDVTETARVRRGQEKELEAIRTEFERFRRETEAEVAQQKGQNEHLIEANRQLEEANRELAEFNQELQIASEEAQLSTEEAQAATEEVETLNEELQATNEELETLNEELQATIEELNTTNEDLQARSAELQELAQASEEEQARLRTILESITDAMLVVSATGRIVFANTAYRRIFGEDGFTARDASGEPLPREDTPRERSARGEKFSMEIIVDGVGGARRFTAQGYPTGGEDGKGGVIVFREIKKVSG